MATTPLHVVTQYIDNTTPNPNNTANIVFFDPGDSPSGDSPSTVDVYTGQTAIEYCGRAFVLAAGDLLAAQNYLLQKGYTPQAVTIPGMPLLLAFIQGEN